MICQKKQVLLILTHLFLYLKKKHLYFKKKHQEVIIIAEILREFHGNTVFPKIIAIPRVINSLK